MSEIMLIKITATARFLKTLSKIIMIVLIIAATVSAIMTGLFMALPDNAFTIETTGVYKISSDIYKYFEKDSERANAIIDSLDKGLGADGFERTDTEDGVAYTQTAATNSVSIRKLATSFIPIVIQMVLLTVIFYFLSGFFKKISLGRGLFLLDAAKELRIVAFLLWGYVIVKLIGSSFTDMTSVSFLEIIFVSLFMFLANIYYFASSLFASRRDQSGDNGGTEI